MKANEIMKKTTLKFNESDFITDSMKSLLARNEEVGLVYDNQEKLVGYFSFKEFAEGIVRGHSELRDIVVKDFRLIYEQTKVESLNFTHNEVLPVMKKNDKVTGFVKKCDFLHAIAEQKRYEYIRLEKILDSVQNGILAINVEGKISFINSPAEKMALTTREKAVGKFLNDVVTPSGLLNVIRTGEGHTEKYKVGNRMYIAHRTPIYNHKQLVGAVGVFQDISDVEFISNELDSVKQLVNELDSIVHNSNDGICIVDPSGNIIRKNKKFDEFYFNDLTEEDKRNDFFSMINRIVEEKSTDMKVEKNAVSGRVLKVSAIPVKILNEVVERVIVRIQDLTELDSLQQELEKARFFLKSTQLDEKTRKFVAVSEVMKNIVKKAEEVAPVDVTILISGESGVGKNELANMIRDSSFRKNKPYVKVNCSTIPVESMEKELFGYGGENPSSNTGKAGIFEYADGGTVLLDGIEKIPLRLQAKLLTVLQEQSITRMGSTESKKVDVRLVATTNQDLLSLVKSGEFREDLFYKVNIVRIVIPPLRERTEDILELTNFYSEVFSERYKKKIKITDEALQTMMENHWNGNIQELINYIERIFVMSHEKDITVKQLDYLFNEEEQIKAGQQKPIIVNKIMPLKEAVEELERELIAQVGKTGESYREIAKILQVNPSTIARKVQKLRKYEEDRVELTTLIGGERS